MKRLMMAAALTVLAAGCSSNECKLDDPKSCSGDNVCEVVQGQDKPACFAPVEIQGRVFDLATDGGVVGATVIALDENGSPAGNVAVSATDGTYAVKVPTTRSDMTGAIQGFKVTLRAEAKDYIPFPSGIRTSLPIDTSAATRAANDKPFVVGGDAAAIGLQQAASRGNPSVSGTVATQPGQRAALVVAESGTGASLTGVSAFADSSGKFTIFNVPAGNYSVKAYTRGVNFTPASVSVTNADVTGVSIARATTSTATVSGNVDEVAGGAGMPTSVILVARSTFNPTIGRGDSPPGLRAPDPGIAPNVTSFWAIDGVPDGEYVVLAGFENDGVVRDPDTQLGGTDVQFVTVSGGVVQNTLSSFKVTNAVTTVSPGADTVETTTATPTFTWGKYPSTARYDLQIFDSLGNQVGSTISLTNVTVTGSNVTYTYSGSPALTPGVYQWRVTALNTNGVPISRTEDLRGVFRVAP